MIRPMDRSPLTLFFVLWACLALPLQGLAYPIAALSSPTQPATAHHHAAPDGTRSTHHASPVKHSQVHPCCPDVHDASCSHAMSYGTGCAASCTGTTSMLTDNQLPPHRVEIVHGFIQLPLTSLLTPAHGSQPLRPPA